MSEFQAGAGIWGRSGWLPASPMARTNLGSSSHSGPPLPPPAPIQGFAKQAALAWKESDSGRQESWDESGRQGLNVGPPPRGMGLSQQEEHEPVPRAHWVRGQSCRSCRNALLASQWRIVIITTALTPTFQTCQGASTSTILSGTNLRSLHQEGLGSSSVTCPHQTRQVTWASAPSVRGQGGASQP